MRKFCKSRVGIPLTGVARLVPWKHGTGEIIATLILAFGLWAQPAMAQRQAVGIATLLNGGVSSVALTDGGAGYDVAPAIRFSGGGGNGAMATSTVSGGAVTSIHVVAPGSGYVSTPGVVIDPPPPVPQPASLSVGMAPVIALYGATGEVQQVQYADSLGDTNHWFALATVVIWANPTFVSDTATPSGGRRLYRSVSLTAPGPDPQQWAWVPPNTYLMGSPATEHDRSDNEGPQTLVTLSKGFWISRFEVTQGQYSSLIGTNPATFLGDTNRPVETITWYDATNYCGLLTAQERSVGRVPAGYEYRLPTEAEWECAARSGTTTSFSFGEDPTYAVLPSYAWFGAVSLQTSHPVGTRRPSPWGIYDMAGNVWEWCRDYYGSYPGGSADNPTGPVSGTYHVMRGGSWHFPGGDARSADRNFNAPAFSSFGIGFRPVLGPTLQ